MYKVWCETAEALDAEIAKYHEDSIGVIKFFSDKVIPIGVVNDGNSCCLVSREVYDVIDLPEQKSEKLTPKLFVEYVNSTQNSIMCYVDKDNPTFEAREDNVIIFHDLGTNKNLFRFDWDGGFAYCDCEDLFCSLTTDYGDSEIIKTTDPPEDIFKAIMADVAQCIGESKPIIDEVMKYGKV